MPQLILNYNVEYSNDEFDKKMLETGCTTTHLMPTTVHHRMNMNSDGVKRNEPQIDQNHQCTHSNKSNKSSCYSAVSVRLDNNPNKYSLENCNLEHSKESNYSKTVMHNSLNSSYTKETLKLPPLRTNHRKKIKSKGHQLHDFVKEMLSVNSSGLTTPRSPTKTKVSVKSSTKTKSSSATSRTKFTLLPSLGTTSFITLLTIICLETVLLSTMTTCAKTFYMHWNTSNSIFRIDNTDHIIDVNKGNLAFEFDQVHIICPVYEPGTFENETEKYIIYNVSKVEYETCRITNADPRVIAICDKPHKLMFFTITFRPFTPQPGGLEFLPGNDYYFISTSSKDDLYRRIGGRCSTNNMKVVFKVCCAQEEKNKTAIAGGNGGKINSNSAGGIDYNGNTVTSSSENINNIDSNVNKQVVNHGHGNGVNTINTGLIPNSGININSATNNGINLSPIGGSGTSINTNVEQFNRIPIQPNGINVIGNGVNTGAGFSSHGGNGIMLTPGHNGINMIPTGSVGGVGIGQFPGLHGQTGIRINNVPPHHQYPTHKSNNDDLHHYGKHPNEVVKNEELTYNSGGHSIHALHHWKIPFNIVKNLLNCIDDYVLLSKSIMTSLWQLTHSITPKLDIKQANNFIYFNPKLLISILLAIIVKWSYNYNLSTSKDSDIVFKYKSKTSEETSTKLPLQKLKWPHRVSSEIDER